MLSLAKFTPDVECRALNSAADRCAFINQTEDCANGVGLANYLNFLYCTTDANLSIFGVIVLGVWMLFLFIGLATAANSFFCPALQVMAEKMKMSHNVAGVTLLALGNGAPDIFSSLAGIRQGRADLAFGELFGAGIFCTTVIAGSISFLRPFHVMERPFLRDCVFYLVAVYFVFWVFYHRHVHVGHAIAFIALYVVYVIVVVVGRLLNSRMNRREVLITSNDVIVNEESRNEDLDAIEPSPLDDDDEVLLVTDDSIEQVSVWAGTKEEFVDLYQSVRPFSLEDFKSMRWFNKIIAILEVPFYMVLRLTIPLVSEDRPRQGWSRPLMCLQLMLTPTWMTWALGYGKIVILKFLPLPLLVFLVGLGLALLLAIFTDRKREPKGHWLLAFVAFAVAVIWIDFIATEIMAVLFTFGVVFQLSDAILGLTILAWGNSVGDFAADVSMARQNAPRMGFSACYGAPLLNTLLGLGISFTIVCTQLGQSVPVSFNYLNLIMTVSLGASLVVVLIYLPLVKFQANKWLGLVLLTVYLAFVTTAVLQEAGCLFLEEI